MSTACRSFEALDCGPTNTLENDSGSESLALRECLGRTRSARTVFSPYSLPVNQVKDTRSHLFNIAVRQTRTGWTADASGKQVFRHRQSGTLIALEDRLKVHWLPIHPRLDAARVEALDNSARLQVSGQEDGGEPRI